MNTILKAIGRAIIAIMEYFHLRDELNKWEKKDYDEMKRKVK